MNFNVEEKQMEQILQKSMKNKQKKLYQMLKHLKKHSTHQIQPVSTQLLYV